MNVSHPKLHPKFYTLIVFILSLILSSISFKLQADNEQSTLDKPGNDSVVYSEAEFAQLLAPIALYPDSLLTHILIASTYPLEVIEAQRWAEKEQVNDQTDYNDLLKDKKWDPSVKALVPFDKVLNQLSIELSWTKKLGDAFLNDEEGVLDAIQKLRLKAKKSGNLENIDKMEVTYEQDNIVLVSSEPDIVYVPVYNTKVIYGSWPWYQYPPICWPYPTTYPTAYYGGVYWYKPVTIQVNYYFNAFHWYNRHLVTINPIKTRYYRSRAHIVSQGYSKRWHHKPSHRKGVAYSNKKLHKKYIGRSGPKYISKNASKKLTHARGKSLRAKKQYDKLRHLSSTSKKINKPKYVSTNSQKSSKAQRVYASSNRHVSKNGGDKHYTKIVRTKIVRTKNDNIGVINTKVGKINLVNQNRKQHKTFYKDHPQKSTDHFKSEKYTVKQNHHQNSIKNTQKVKAVMPVENKKEYNKMASTEHAKREINHNARSTNSYKRKGNSHQRRHYR